MSLLSFVIPCYRSEKTIAKVVEEIKTTVEKMEGYDYEIIAVNDSSPDDVYKVMCELARENKKLKIVNLAKNMGKHSAVMAGYSLVKGEYVVNLDDDCQCPVYELPRLMEPLINDECDVATASYYKKKESGIKNLGSDVNLMMTNFLLDKPKNLRMENFNVMKRFVVDEMVKYKNPYPFLEGLIFRVTRSVTQVKMEERDRGDDNASGFTIGKSMSLLFNGLTAFSVKPLRIAAICGVLFSTIGFIYGTVTIVRKLLNPDIMMGYSSIMAVLLFTSGIIMLMLGLIGEYLGRIYICLNNSPQYVIRNIINGDENETD